MPTDKQTDNQAAGSATIASGIGDVVNAALSVGAAVARTVAAATSPGGNISRPGASSGGPFAEIVHYSVEAAANFAHLVVVGVNSKIQPASHPAGPAPAATHPAVHAGSTLRIPLSIENPSDAEMAQMTFYCESLTYQGKSSGSPLTAGAFAFQPVPLTVAAHDFEKITIFIITAEETAPGMYLARIMVQGGNLESSLHFEVLPAAEAAS